MSGPAVVLVGPMGVGKSTVGALLARWLGTTCRDTDDDVVQAAGKQVSDIFLEDGEERFRALEQEAVAAALTDHSGVLSLGGGAVLAPQTRALLTGLPVVFLEMTVRSAVKRVGLDAPRPLLIINPRQQWKALMEQRRPLYTEVARAIVDTEDRTPEEVARAVMDALELKTA